MRQIHGFSFLAIGLLAVPLSACGDRVAPAVGNSPAPVETPGRGGPCGDGTVLAPGQNCP